MNRRHTKRFQHLYKEYRGNGGKLAVGGVAQSDAADALSALGCLDEDAIGELLEYLDGLNTTLIGLQSPSAYVPDEIPSRESRPTIYVKCPGGGSPDAHIHYKWN